MVQYVGEQEEQGIMRYERDDRVVTRTENSNECKHLVRQSYPTEEGSGSTEICIVCGSSTELDGKGQPYVADSLKLRGSYDDRLSGPERGKPSMCFPLYWQQYTYQRGRGQWRTRPHDGEYQVEVYYKILAHSSVPGQQCKIVAARVSPPAPECVLEAPEYTRFKRVIMDAFAEVFPGEVSRHFTWEVL